MVLCVQCIDVQILTQRAKKRESFSLSNIVKNVTCFCSPEKLFLCCGFFLFLFFFFLFSFLFLLLFSFFIQSFVCVRRFCYVEKGRLCGIFIFLVFLKKFFYFFIFFCSEMDDLQEFTGAEFSDFALDFHIPELEDHHQDNVTFLPPTPFNVPSLLSNDSLLERIPNDLRDVASEVEVFDPLTKPRLLRSQNYDGRKTKKEKKKKVSLCSRFLVVQRGASRSQS